MEASNILKKAKEFRNYSSHYSI